MLSTCQRSSLQLCSPKQTGGEIGIIAVNVAYKKGKSTGKNCFHYSQFI